MLNRNRSKHQHQKHASETYRTTSDLGLKIGAKMKQNVAENSRKTNRKTSPKKKGARRLILTILGSFGAPFWDHFWIIFGDKIGVGFRRGFDMDPGCFWSPFRELFGTEIRSF